MHSFSVSYNQCSQLPTDPARSQHNFVNECGWVSLLYVDDTWTKYKTVKSNIFWCVLLRNLVVIFRFQLRPPSEIHHAIIIIIGFKYIYFQKVFHNHVDLSSRVSFFFPWCINIYNIVINFSDKLDGLLMGNLDAVWPYRLCLTMEMYPRC